MLDCQNKCLAQSNGKVDNDLYKTCLANCTSKSNDKNSKSKSNDNKSCHTTFCKA
jgi:hypothetical protein